MSIEQDQVSPELAELTEYTSQLMDRVALLAVRTAYLGEQGESGYDLHRLIRDELCDLNDELHYLPHVEYSYNGRGFAPITLPDGDEHTAYSLIQNGKGRFHELVLADTERMSYILPEEADVYTMDDSEGSLIDHHDKTRLEGFKNSILEPPTGDRLFLEMLQASYEGMDTTLAGSSVRAHQYSVYHILDACDFKLDYISVDPEEPVKTVEVYELANRISDESDAFRTLVKSTPFRRATLPRQIQQLGQKLRGINQALHLERVFAIIAPKEIYVPDVGGGNHRMVKRKLPPYVSGFDMDPIRVDSLEFFPLGNGRRIHRDSSMVGPDAGLCLIGQVDELVMEQLELTSPVVWIPVSSQDFECMFIPIDER